MHNERKERGLNFNTFLHSLMLVLVGSLGYLARSELEDIKGSQKLLWQAIMPRQEIELRIEQIKEAYSRNETELQDLRTRMNQLETQLKKQ